MILNNGSVKYPTKSKTFDDDLLRLFSKPQTVELVFVELGASVQNWYLEIEEANFSIHDAMVVIN